MRICAAFTAIAMFGSAAPAQAQFYWTAPPARTATLTGAEPESGVNLPGATSTELRAGLLWNLRAALNVAALQCDFEPTLLTVSNYNAMLGHHGEELGSAFKTIASYFTRTYGAGRSGQTQFDQYGTRTYSAYSTVQAQRIFCQVAGSVGRDAIFAPRGQLYRVAETRLADLRAALKPYSENIYGNPGYGFVADLPPLDKKCWKKSRLTKKCAAALSKE